MAYSKNDLSNLWYRTQETKYQYIRTSNKHFKDEYQRLYSEYKKAGGKRKLK